MTGLLLGALVLLLVGAAAFLAGGTLASRSWAELVLAAYLVASAGILALVLVLSAFGALTRAALVAGSAAFLAGTVGVWLLADAPRVVPRPPRRTAPSPSPGRCSYSPPPRALL